MAPALRLLLALSAAFSALADAASLAAPNSSNIPSRLWATSSGRISDIFSDGYPIGNGHIGAMLIGDIPNDLIVVNEDSRWSGNLLHRVNQDAAPTVREMQGLVQNGLIQQAHTLGGLSYVGTPTSTRHYMPIGFMSINQNITGQTSSYERWLDIADSTGGVYFVHNGVQYQRDFIASNPDDVIAVHLTASAPGMINFNTHLDAGVWGSLNHIADYSFGLPDQHAMVMGGTSEGGANATAWCAGLTIVASGGRVYTQGDYVLVENADEATVYFSSWTSYRKSDPQAAVLAALSAVSKRDYADVLSDHVADYRQYADTFQLDFGQSTAAQRANTTSKRMTAISPTSFDPELAALAVQYGRYMLIATSRNGTLPPNLQGIWNDNLDPEWGSKYTVNINLQMNYWPSLTTGLEDLVPPLFEYLKTMSEQGKIVAKKMYNASGTVTHHNSDLWGDSAPQDNYLSSTFWPLGSAWMAEHVIDYYRFTGNQTALKDMLDYLVDNVQFALDFLTPYRGYMVTNPSLSPENTYYLPGTNTSAVAITAGPTIDNSILWELFGFIEEIQQELGLTSGDLAKQAAAMRAKLPPLRLNQYNGIAEWMEDFTEAQPGISHMSNLWGAYPGPQITSANETTFAAAQESLDHRLINGGGACGWSRAWVVALGGRFFNSSVVNEYFTTQLSVCSWNISMLNQGGATPFQIDANFGLPAGLVEALGQSHEWVKTSSSNCSTNGTSSWSSTGADLAAAYTGDTSKAPLIRLLPALPAQWAHTGGAGSVKGLTARGGFVVDIAWGSDGKLQQANVTSKIGGSACVTSGSNVIGSAATSNSTLALQGGSRGAFVCLKATAGTTYKFTSA